MGGTLPSVAALPATAVAQGVFTLPGGGWLPTALAAQFGLALLAGALGELREARSAVASEGSRTRGEREAFAAFEGRARALEPTAERSASTSAGGALLRTDGSGAAARRVRDAYRERVMEAVDGGSVESPLEHFCAEVGPRVAAAVFRDDQFTPEVKRRLLCALEERQAKRHTLLTVLDREADELAAVESRLDDVAGALDGVRDSSPDAERGRVDTFPDRSYGCLQHEWFRLDALDQRVRTVLRERQRYRQSVSVNGARTADFDRVLGYVYEPLDTDHPCLSAGLRLQRGVATERRRRTDALARRL